MTRANFQEVSTLPKLQYAPRSTKQSKSIPEIIRREMPGRILSYAKKHFKGKFTHIDVHFRGDLCYLDAYCDPAVRSEALPLSDTRGIREYLKAHADKVMHLCRLRYLGSRDAWGFDFFAHSSNRYEPSVFFTGLPTGTPEDAFDLAAGLYLSD
jgi:hypothetical protein